MLRCLLVSPVTDAIGITPLELCGLVEARVIDLEGVHDPCRPNDRLLLGMKGSISEFELGILRTRMLDAARSKARRERPADQCASRLPEGRARRRWETVEQDDLVDGDSPAWF